MCAASYVSPSYAATERRKSLPDAPIGVRWSHRKPLRRGSRTWKYLHDVRALPETVLGFARRADVVREGPHGSAWFAHRDAAGAVTHIEIRGPTYKGSVKGGSKTLFRLPSVGPRHRIVVTEAPIDALSSAALENARTHTLYGSTGGGMGPATIREIERLVAGFAGLPGAVFLSATDANLAGDRYAAKHEALAAQSGVPFERLRPPIEGGDWNDLLKQSRQRKAP